MKLRIKGNSIRLRLTKSEVTLLAQTGSLNEQTEFGESVFRYSLLCKNKINELSADFKNGGITIFIPEAFVKEWAMNDIVGIEAQMKTNGIKELHLLVEKDFKCLDETTEDQSDNYENPYTACHE